MKVRFAVSPATTAYDPAAVARFALTAEALGFDSIWLSDVPMGPAGDPLIDLAHVAATTVRIRLGANVVPVGRNPMLLARHLAQIDQLSRGRLLLSFVPGLDQPDERRALGFPQGDRGALIEEVLGMLRRWWAGETAGSDGPYLDVPTIAVQPVPVQQPLEVWLGGTGPRSLERVARCGDGWLTAAMDPSEAQQGRTTILARAADLGRHVDEEHFGVSIPYARRAVPTASLDALRARRPHGELSDFVPVGTDAVRDLVGRYLDGGLSKFVLRPLDPTSVEEDLSWLADAVLGLQTSR